MSARASALTWLFPELAPFRERLRSAARSARRAGGSRSFVALQGDVEVCVTSPWKAPENGDGPLLLPLEVDGSTSGGARASEVLELVRAEGRRMRSIPVIPYFASRAADPGTAVHTRMAPSAWGLLPGDHAPPASRMVLDALIRELVPERLFLFRALENAALSGVDPAAELRRAAPRLAPRSSAALLAIDGIDGSGKSTQLERLERHLRGRGLDVARHRLFRHGVFHDTVTDVTRRCAGGRELHLWRLQRLAKLFDSLKVLGGALEGDLRSRDVVLFDRYLPTHYAAGAGRYHADPYAREMLAAFPPADLVVILDLPVSEALQRIDARDERTVDENTYMLGRYREVLLDLADRQGHLVLDAREAPDAIEAKIRRETELALEAPRLSG